MSILKKKLLVSVEKIWTAHKAFLFFSISRQIGALIISIVLSNTDVGLSFIGNYEILLFVGITFTFFVSQGFFDSFNLLFKNANRKSAFTVYFISLLASIAIVGLLIGFEASIVGFLISTSKVEFFFLFCIHLIFDFNTWLTPIFLWRKGFKRLLTYYSFIVNGLWILVVTLPAILKLNLQLIFIGLIGLSLLKHIFLIGLLLSYSCFSFDWTWGKDWLKKSIPFMGYALLGGLHLIADNWMVGHYFPGDKELFAIFRYGARELPLSIIIAAAFSAVTIPLLQKNTIASLKDYKKKSKQLLHVFFLFAIFSMIFAKKLFIAVYGSAFELSAHIFGVYLLVIISRLLIMKPFIMTQNLNHWLVPIALSELFINVVISYLLVPILGIIGIAWGTVIAYTYEKLFMIILLKLKSKWSLSQFLSIPTFTLYSIILTICFFLVF